MRNILLGLLFFAISGARGGEFETANQLYDEGKFSEARQRYQALVEAGQWSANLFHNLGNANYRMGAPGLAMLNYERAVALEPAHPEARANLRLLREQANAKLPDRMWREAAFDVLSLDAWTLVATIAGWCAIFCFVTPLLLRRRAAGALIFFGIVALLVSAYGIAGIWHTTKNLDTAVVIAKQAEARLAPADRAALADVLPAGSRVRVLTERGPWVYCELPGSGLGWLPTGSVEKVRLSKS